MRLPAQITALLAASLVCGAASQLLLPGRVEWRGTWNSYVESQARSDGITIADLPHARQMVGDQAHIVLDARPPADYEKGHLPGAFSLPHQDVDKYFGPLVPILAMGQPILTYCASKDCDEALELTRYLRRNGYTNAVLFIGGFKAWEEARLPVEGRKP